MQTTMARPLALGMAARVRRIPAHSNIEQAANHRKWWREQAAKELEHFQKIASVPSSMGRQVLYRFYTEDGALIYVGVTTNLLKRTRDHSRTASWWDDVNYTVVEHFSNRSDVLAAEKAAIINELPLHNRSHSRRWRQ